MLQSGINENHLGVMSTIWTIERVFPDEDWCHLVSNRLRCCHQQSSAALSNLRQFRMPAQHLHPHLRQYRLQPQPLAQHLRQSPHLLPLRVRRLACAFCTDVQLLPISGAHGASLNYRGFKKSKARRGEPGRALFCSSYPSDLRNAA